MPSTGTCVVRPSGTCVVKGSLTNHLGGLREERWQAPKKLKTSRRGRGQARGHRVALMLTQTAHKGHQVSSQLWLLHFSVAISSLETPKAPVPPNPQLQQGAFMASCRMRQGLKPRGNGRNLTRQLTLLLAGRGSATQQVLCQRWPRGMVMGPKEGLNGPPSIATRH